MLMESKKKETKKAQKPVHVVRRSSIAASLAQTAVPESDPTEEAKQAQMRRAYILQQQRMQCGRGGCGDGIETF